MYLPKHFNFVKYVLISKDTVNERTWRFLKLVHRLNRCTKNGENESLGLDSVQKIITGT